jgi:membrane associated rhomboid family serine protease
VVVSLAVLWSVYLLDWLIPVQFTGWGIVPRRWNGLVGIPLSPLIHDGMGHLVSNSIPLAILMFLFVSSRKKPWLRIVEVALLGGLLLWLFGRNGAQEPVVHVGASLLIYGLIAYLIVIGFREKHPVSLVIALVVGFLYRGTLIWGVLPTSPKISWDGHLAGAIAGAALAFLFPTESAPTDSESPVDLLRRHGFDVD